MKPPHANRPPAVDDHYRYWGDPPPEPSARFVWWEGQIAAGWRPNRRIRGECYDCAAEWYGVYIWEYINRLWPMTERDPSCGCGCHTGVWPCPEHPAGHPLGQP